MEDSISQTYCSISDVIKMTGVTMRQLYYWEKCDFLRPRYEKFGLRQYRRYSSGDIMLVQKIIGYLKEGYNLQTAARKAHAVDGGVGSVKGEA